MQKLNINHEAPRIYNTSTNYLCSRSNNLIHSLKEMYYRKRRDHANQCYPRHNLILFLPSKKLHAIVHTGKGLSESC